MENIIRYSTELTDAEDFSVGIKQEAAMDQSAGGRQFQSRMTFVCSNGIAIKCVIV
jgi:hypothetical protein